MRQEVGTNQQQGSEQDFESGSKTREHNVLLFLASATNVNPFAGTMTTAVGFALRVGAFGFVGAIKQPFGLVFAHVLSLDRAVGGPRTPLSLDPFT